jgi:hypothetical protein
LFWSPALLLALDRHVPRIWRRKAFVYMALRGGPMRPFRAW